MRFFELVFFHLTAPSGSIRATLRTFHIFLLFHLDISILKRLRGACDTAESLRNTQVEKKIPTLKKFNNIVIIILRGASDSQTGAIGEFIHKAVLITSNT